MTHYVDGYVIPLPKRNLAAYRRMAQQAAKVWREHGALHYKECVGEDLQVKWGPTFPRGLKVKAGETVVFSWIEFKSRTHRDRVNAAAWKDPRIAAMCDPQDMPFDVERMLFGGFNIIVAF
jgi:uncharacterized protein YbaA (DUF1428 family)